MPSCGDRQLSPVERLVFVLVFVSGTRIATVELFHFAGLAISLLLLNSPGQPAARALPSLLPLNPVSNGSTARAFSSFSYSALAASAWKDTARVDRRRQTLDQELEAFQFGLEEESIKQQLISQYFPQTEAETVAAAVKEPPALPQVKTSPAIESFVNWLCNRAVPKASVREVQQAKIKGLEGFKSHDIHELFSQAEKAGFGVYDDGVFYHKSLLVG